MRDPAPKGAALDLEQMRKVLAECRRNAEIARCDLDAAQAKLEQAQQALIAAQTAEQPLGPRLPEP